LINIHKISGDSLSPDYRDGDFVISIKIPIFFIPIHPGDVIIFKHSEFGTMIKKIAQINNGDVYVMGISGNSIDSRRFGPINKKDIIGKVILHIRKTAEIKV
jgi:signal peptidase I